MSTRTTTRASTQARQPSFVTVRRPGGDPVGNPHARAGRRSWPERATGKSRDVTQWRSASWSWSPDTQGARGEDEAGLGSGWCETRHTLYSNVRNGASGMAESTCRRLAFT